MNAQEQEWKEEYMRDGYIVVPGVLSREDCAALKVEGLEVLRKHSDPGFTVYVGVAVASDVYYQLASHPRIVEVLKALMPDGVMFLSDKFVFKSGEQRFPTPWHQDEAYWRNTRPKLSVWIALDDVSRHNGALKVLPGRHHSVLDHGQATGVPTNEFTNTIASIPQDAPGEVIAEMKAGDALFFSDLTPHASCPNESGEDRYAIISTYHAPAEDEPFDLGFKARHVIVPKPVTAAA
jgi:ectoine hydroxylase-related dioxygenase (phytanoyl-CoA dioxygenase family)